MKKLVKKVLSSVLCLAMLFSFLQLAPLSASAAISIDIGKNPTPDIDIAVSVPADYPGTFDDFKAELTQALIDQGMDASTFRITDTAVKIDTTNLDGWYVYDHYYSTDAYNALGLSAEQKLKQPYRAADNSYMTSHGKTGVTTPCLIQDVFVAKKFGTPGTKLYPFNQHTYSWSENGRANMCFAGYGTNAKTDFMVYPATSDSRRTIEFDLDCAVIDTHTLDGAGFLLNAAIDSNILNGYAFYYQWTSATAATAQIRKVQDYNAMATGNQAVPGASAILASQAVSLPSGTKLRIRVVLERNKVTVTQRTYTGTTMGPEVTLFDNYSIPVLAAGGNGFGPIVGYKSHGCASMTYFQYGDLAMTYDATAFDALKEVQYVQTAQQKYFINLAGESGPGIPDREKESQGYIDGITRMDQNEIFYMSNEDDEQVRSDEYGLGSDNTFIATSTDPIAEMARIIAENYAEEKTFTHVNPIESVTPLSDFYIINSTKDENGNINGSQLLTVHQRHLINNNSSIQVSLKDKSKLGTLDGAGDAFSQYIITLNDPDGNPVTGFNKLVVKPNADGSVTFPSYTVDKNSKPGRYTFSMVVVDNKGNESGTSSTYFTVFDDSDEPIATGENTSKNHATITLTDTGQGIDDDGITFIEDNRGSGVYAYYVTDQESTSDSPLTNPDLWIYLDEPVHQFSFDVDLTQYTGKGNKLVVYYMDECQNSGEIAVFKPVHVVVETPDGEPIDDYYIIGETPVIVLPDDVPDAPGDDYEFSNWEIVPPGDNPPGGGDPITSGKEIPVDPDDDEPTITIRPSYTDTKVNLIYNANADGAYIMGTEDSSATTSYAIAQNSDIAAKIKLHGVVPVREGYAFQGWYLDQACTNPVKDQVAATDTTVYAKWEIASYTLYFDHNGGGTSGVRSKTVVYNTLLSEINNENSIYYVKPNENPTREGYIFNGWSLVPNDESAVIGTTRMPGSDFTIYALWKVDTSKYVVHFDSNGGGAIGDKSYGSADATYGNLQKPVRAGYVFEGWYEKIVDEDGNVTFGDEKVELTNHPILAKYKNMATNTLQDKEHTLIAKWSPATDTKVNVAYYLNSGVKDENGNYKYIKANNLTTAIYGTTESTITVPDELLIDELKADENNLSRDYWLNLDVHPEERTGVVTGATTLELKLYYDRYFSVQGVVISGDETGSVDVSQATRVKEGSHPTITWAPAEGYHTANIILDNRVRDGLLNLNSYTLEEEIHKDYYFRVRFDKGGAPVNPAAKDYYSIDTMIEGCYDGSCTITPSGRYIAGRDSVEIGWNIDTDYYKVVSVKIDQTVYFKDEASAAAYTPAEGEYVEVGPSYFDNSFARFRKIAHDHSVVVTVEKLPTVGGGVTAGNYTVTVNTYGGDGKYDVTPTTVAKPGEAVQVKWAKQNASVYNVAAVYVDGVKQTIAADKINTSSLTFSKIDANHVVDIYFTKDEPSDDPNQEIPSYDRDLFNKLTTQIVGGPGTITGGGYVGEDNKDQTIKWEINDPDASPTDDDYTYYDITSVTVNGKEYSLEDIENNALELKIEEDTEVIVNVEPAYCNVNVYRYGTGKTTESRTYYKYQSYIDLSGWEIANTGFSLVKVVVDGEVMYDRFASTDDAETVSFFSMLRNAISPLVDDVDKVSVANQTDSQVDLKIENLNVDHDVEYYFTHNDLTTGKPTPAPAVTHRVSADITNAPGASISGQCIVDDNGEATIEWNVPEGYEVKSVTVNDEVYAVDGNSLKLTGITGDQNVSVALVKTAKDNTTERPVNPDVDTQYNIATSVIGGKGEITPPGKYNEGGSPTITWKAIPQTVTTNCIFDTEEYAEYHASLVDEFDPITGKLINEGKLDYDSDGDGKPDINVDVDGDGYPDYNLDIDCDGVADHNILKAGETFDPANPDYSVFDGEIIKYTRETVHRDFTVKYVIVDGVVRTDLVDAGSITFENLDKDHSVVVVVEEAKNLPPNVDTDGDGSPDINIDVDGDGEPDTNIDVTGDGEPDVNIDDDDDGIPDRNIDKDGDGKVDTSVHVYYKDAQGNDLYPDKLILGNMGDEFTTDYEENADYDVTIPENASGQMLFVEEEVVYIYTPKATSIKVEFVDEEGNSVYDSEVIGGHVFEQYADKAASALKDAFDSGKLANYNLVDSKNTVGTMTLEQQTVTYVFALKDSKITVNYVDEDGNPVYGKVSITTDHKFGDEYKVEPDTNVYGYELDTDKLPENAEGVIGEDEIVVTFVYNHKNATVDVKYIDVDSNEELDAETISGKVFAEYKTEAKDFYGYELVSVPANANGTFKETEDNDAVVYMYKLKNAEVVVEYVDENGNEIAKSDTLTGKVGDAYTSSAKAIANYELVSVTENANGTFKETEDNDKVVYTYKLKDAKLIVKHLHADGTELKSEEFDVKYGENYTTSKLDDDQYSVLSVIGDATGVIDNDVIIVIYTYVDKNAEPKPPVNPQPPVQPENPDINIDTDNDGEPDVNIDTDGDGVPDINIDTDGDGVPDINIDTDGDGVPDINIDTTGDGIPNINIDTTGDGIPNINIDTTGDGIPNINIDTDGDGVADINIDTDGDGVADINIDTDGDGVADANIDTNGDGVADKNIIGAPVDTGSNDMFRIAAFSMFTLVAAFALVLIMRKNRKESEAEAE